MKKSILLLTLSTLISGQVMAATAPQTETAKTTWSRQYGGVDKSYDTQLLAMRAQIAPTFKQLTFTDEKTGVTMDYNLFIPKNYDASKKYPLVLFMADASTVGKGVMAPLMQGYGGIIWASDAVQAKHPAFVLVPSYKGPERAVNDDWSTSKEVPTTLDLLDKVVHEYAIDQDRIYTTGQSMGGMMSFYFNATHPDLFAASLFVGSQWDINVLQPLAQQKFFYIVSAGDDKASKGMAEVAAMLDKDGVKYGKTTFSAKLPEAEQNAKAAALIKAGYPINFIQFDKGSVLPVGIDAGRGGEHMYSFDYAYQLTAVRDWLFTQHR